MRAATGQSGLTAVILAGGGATRLGGRDKPSLPIAGVSMLDRVLAAVAGSDARIVVGPPRPGLPADVVTVREDPPGAGPAAATAAALAVIPSTTAASPPPAGEVPPPSAGEASAPSGGDAFTVPAGDAAAVAGGLPISPAGGGSLPLSGDGAFVSAGGGFTVPAGDAAAVGVGLPISPAGGGSLPPSGDGALASAGDASTLSAGDASVVAAGRGVGSSGAGGSGRDALIGVFAADLPHLTAEAVAVLVAAVGQGVDGAVFVDGRGKRQLLCGVWRAGALRSGVERLGDPVGKSMRAVFDGLVVAEVGWERGGVDPYFDCDTDEDLRRAEQQQARRTGAGGQEKRSSDERKR